MLVRKPSLANTWILLSSPPFFFVAGEKEAVAGPGLLPKGYQPNDSWPKNKKKGTTNRGKKTLRRYNPAHTREEKKETKGNKTQSQK